jgi:hypothetical protein
MKKGQQPVIGFVFDVQVVETVAAGQGAAIEQRLIVG